MKEIAWDNFESVELNTWTIVRVEDFPEARNPAYKIWIDFGGNIWQRKTSAQITSLYTKADLIWKQIIAVTNFPEKQIGNFMSQCLIAGFYSGDWVVLAVPDKNIDNWLKLA